MEYVAHRAGNDPDLLKAAEGRVDLVELDVHRGRTGQTMVRHAKRLWPTSRLWDRWYLVPADATVPDLEAILAAARPDTALWFDVKGVSTDLADRLTAMANDGERRVVVSSKSWWLLAGFTGTPNLRTFRSAGNRFELMLLLWLPTRVSTDGAVVHRRLLTPGTLDRLMRRGPVFTWGVNDRSTIEELEQRGIAGVILDDIELIDRDS